MWDKRREGGEKSMAGRKVERKRLKERNKDRRSGEGGGWRVEITVLVLYRVLI